MSIVVLQLPDVNSEKEERPRKCPYCGGEIFQRWGGVKKSIRDHKIQAVGVYRYRCCRCRRTFRDYPDGVDRADQSRRLRKLAALVWVLGLSYRGLEAVLTVFGVKIGRMSVWRDVQELGQSRQKEMKWRPVRVLGVDGAYVRGWGETQPVLVAVDMGTGQPVAIGKIDEKDPKAVKEFLEPLVQRLWVSVIVTDDLFSYKKVSEELDLTHQVCQFHVRRWVGRALYEQKAQLPAEWQETLAEVKRLVTELPPDGDKRLLALWRKIPENRAGRSGQALSPLDQLRHLLVRLAENWARFRVFDWQPDVPWTNNQTEQAIGRMKMRARTVRGYKTWSGMQNALFLAGTGMI
jgi:transposase-like protein/DNA-directed RNA polymerase subunit RPC12/RpoP